jgi:hypothetical protein
VILSGLLEVLIEIHHRDLVAGNGHFANEKLFDPLAPDGESQLGYMHDTLGRKYGRRREPNPPSCMYEVGWMGTISSGQRSNTNNANTQPPET